MGHDASIAPLESLRQTLRSFLKFSNGYSPTDVRVGNEQQEDGFGRTLVSYTAADGEKIEAFLFQPQNEEPKGAVLALHQHNSQWMIGKSEIAGLIGDSLQAFGPTLARRGLIVLAPDAVGFESRLTCGNWGSSLAPSLTKPYSTADGWLQYYNQMAHRLVRGDLLMRKILEDGATALSVLHDLTGKTRLGVIGHSFGGITALFLAALDTRIAFACTSGAVCSFRHKLATGTALEMSLVMPNFAVNFDLEDLLRCVAPRNVLVVSSDGDPQSADAERVVQNALPAYEKYNCTSHLQQLRCSGTHDLDIERFEAILDWTEKQASAS